MAPLVLEVRGREAVLLLLLGISELVQSLESLEAQ